MKRRLKLILCKNTNRCWDGQISNTTTDNAHCRFGRGRVKVKVKVEVEVEVEGGSVCVCVWGGGGVTDNGRYPYHGLLIEYGPICHIVKLRISMIRPFSLVNNSHITLYPQLEIIWKVSKSLLKYRGKYGQISIYIKLYNARLYYS